MTARTDMRAAIRASFPKVSLDQPAVIAAGAELRVAEESLHSKRQDLTRARRAEEASKAEAARLAGRVRAGLDRHSRNVRTWIASGCLGPRPKPESDARAEEHHAAEAEAAADRAAVASFEAEVAEASEVFDRAAARVQSEINSVLSAHLTELIALVKSCWSREFELFRIIGALGLTHRPVGAAALEDLANPPARPDLSMMFSSGSVAVCEDVNTPRLEASQALSESSAYWQQLERSLEQLATAPSNSASEAA